MPKPMTENTLFYGDNLAILKEYAPDEAVDLVYLDPPFNSNASYNVLFDDKKGEKSAAQLEAFKDTWTWPEAALTFEELKTDAGPMGKALRSFGELLPKGAMLAYLTMMAPRLRELRRVLKPTGSIYLHCDPTASHYLKVLMDAIFGVKSFRNEIIWQRTNVHSDSKTWSSVSDTILFYTKGDSFIWNPQYAEHDEDYVRSKYRHDDHDGRGMYRLGDITSPHARPNMMYEWNGHQSPPNGWRYSKETMAKLDAEGRIWYPADKSKRPQLKRYLNEMRGTLMSTVWTDIRPINSQARERLGYPTQKPEALLERIIQASSNPGDWVLDPFCGCGTAITVAQRLNRKWIGIDITQAAIQTIKKRLNDAFKGQAAYKVVGEPVSVYDAQQLADSDPYQFQWWSLGLLGARPDEKKKGADKGIDGRLYFNDGQKTQQVILSVKAGHHIGVNFVNELRGVVERENAQIGVLITMHPPTKPMMTCAAEAGFYTSQWGKHPRIQLLTVADLLAGKGIDYPGANVTYKQAPKAGTEDKGQLGLGV